MNGEPILPVIDYDARTVTMAVTFRWSDEWSLDKCEAIYLLGLARRGIAEAITEAGTELVTGFSTACYDPHEELEMGYFPGYENPVCAGCGKPVRHTFETWRAPEFWEHVDPISPDEPCDRLSGRAEHGPVVIFPNLLDTTFPQPEVPA